MNESLRAELVELIAAQLEGSSTPKQHEQLERLMETLAAARQFYIDHLDIHASLSWERVSGLRTLLLEEGLAAADEEAIIAVDPAADPLFLKRRGQVRGSFSSPRPLHVLAASVLFVACMVAGGLVVWNRTGRAEVATLTATSVCVWQADTGFEIPAVGTQFEMNRLLEIRSGVAQLTFANGPVVHIEGPARFVVQSSRRGLLEHGKLLVEVPPRAVGFCIVTPTMEVIDLGTEFGVYADAQGATEVQVFRGLVEVGQPAAAIRDQAPINRVRLLAGETIASDARGLSAVAKAHDSDRFNNLVRAIAKPTDAEDKLVVVDFATDPGWTGTNHTKHGNKYGWSAATNHAGATAGEVGGTFARNQRESSYGDTNLRRTFTLDDSVSAAGRLFVSDVATMNGELFVGHYSLSMADKRREFIGLEICEDHAGAVKACARVYRPDGKSDIGATSSSVVLPAGTAYHFEYSYDAKFEADAQHHGPEGKITLRIHSDGGAIDEMVSVELDGVQRDAGGTFDAFGIGTAAGTVSTDDANKTARAFIDNVKYSGARGP